VIALDTAGNPGSVDVNEQGTASFTATVPSTGASATEKIGIVVKGSAAQ
jgi:hypothetical protein